MNVDLHELDQWRRTVDDPTEGWFVRRVCSGSKNLLTARLWHTPCACSGVPGHHVWGMPGCIGEKTPLQAQILDFPPETRQSVIISVWNWWPVSYQTYLTLMEERAWDGAKED